MTNSNSVGSEQKRTGKELIKASISFAKEKRAISWMHTLLVMVLVGLSFYASLIYPNLYLKTFFGVLTGLFLVRFFIIYHDYNHHAILKNSALAKVIMTVYGWLILAPRTIWKRSHDHHHRFNSKLSNSGVGSYPLLAREDFYKLTKTERSLYLAARNPLTIAFGYITLFVFDFNIKTFIQSPKNHWDSLIALSFHGLVYYLIYTNFGLATTLLTWTLPFIIANGLGSYLFYAQHNFPGAVYTDNKDWDFTAAAINSTSFLKMGPIMNWFTGDIGYHHVHHLNHHIPFYRLREAMDQIPELQDPKGTTLSPKDVIACLRLKVWDPEKGEMAPL